MASDIANGTSSTRASVLARRVFPEPVGPLQRIRFASECYPISCDTHISKTFDFSKTVGVKGELRSGGR